MISILLPAFNAERFLGEAIDSVLRQTMPEFELIVIDDGSTDGTLEIAREYASADPRVRVYTQPNSGTAHTLNRALELARHELIARIDADDRMLPHRLERQLQFIRENSDLAVAGTLIRYITEDGKKLGVRWSPFTTRAAITDAIRRNKIIAVPHNSVLMRRSTVIGVGGYRPQFVVVQDLDLWNRLAEGGHSLLVQPEVLTEYRVHGSSAGFGSSRLTYVSIEWVQDCMIRRRAGVPERSLEEFLAEMRAQPWHRRFSWERRLLARMLYTDSVREYARQNYLRVAAKLLPSLLLNPRYVAPRVRRRLLRGAS